MKVTVTKEDGEDVIFSEASSVFIALTQLMPRGKDQIHFFQETRSYSWGDKREIVKELQQSIIELQSLIEEERRK